MNSQQKIINLLTICIKAGKTVRGFDSVCEELKSGNAACVMTASDISPKTLKEVRFVCGKYNTRLIETSLTKEIIGALSRKQSAVIAVCDAGFAKRFAELSDEASDESAD